MRRLRRGVLLLFLAAGSARAATDPGALVRLDTAASVSVLLDEIPAGRLRDSAASEALQKDAAFWKARVQRQLDLMTYRLVFRAGFYPGESRGAMPLPPRETWKITLVGKAKRSRADGHDAVVQAYRWSSMLVTDAASPAIVEPNLAVVGGTWDEPFQLPRDPELLLERTGYACMDEFEFPPNSAFEENVQYYYDQTCGVEAPETAYCHLTTLPAESCVGALQAHVGMVSPNVRFTRLPWSAAVAAANRVGTVTNPNGANLLVREEYMLDEHVVYYKYFTPDSCEIGEGVVAKPGWRQLLTFSATVENSGTQPLHIGNPTDPGNPWVQSNVFQYSACHNHYHFSHYGSFGYNGAPGAKRAFCLEDTNRYRNDETSPLWATHQSCEFQGIGAGWGDEYNIGLPGQWVDITDVDSSAAHDLTFDANPDRFLCEGQTLNASGQPVDPTDLSQVTFEPSEFAGTSRIRCNLPANWQADNRGVLSFSSSVGGYITEACTRGQIGPLRSCGLDNEPQLKSCTPGSTVRLTCTASDNASVVRICERSSALGRGIPCTVGASQANGTAADSTSLTFTCPALRDGAGGGYAIFSGPLLPWESGGAVRCR